MISLALLSLLAVSPAQASSMLEPQNRLHVGVSFVDSPSPFGLSAGFDSRLTRVISMDVGAFLSPLRIAPDVALLSDYPAYYELRHGLYVMPGLRIPHGQPRNWAFDVFLRAGGGAIWVANTDPTRDGFQNSNYIVAPCAAGMAGGDALVRFKRVGLRISGKAVAFGATRDVQEESWVLVRSQWAAEGFFQW